MNKQTQINQLKEVIKNNPEGFTIKYNTLKEDDLKGYCVAITNLKGKSINPLIKKVLYTINSFSQIKNKIYVGGWSDKGYFYLDLTLKVQDKKQAESLGFLFNQLSIFDLNSFSEIPINRK